MALKIAVFSGLFGCGGIACAADDTLPDLEFLEYLGSWEESDEDWLLFNEDAQAAQALQETERSEGEPETAPAGKESTELENES